MQCRHTPEVKMVFHLSSVSAGAFHLFFSSFLLPSYPFPPEAEPTFNVYASITDAFLSVFSLQGTRAAAIWAFHNGGSENAEGGSICRHAGWLSEGGSPNGRVWQSKYCQAFRYLDKALMYSVPPSANLLWGCWGCRGEHAFSAGELFYVPLQALLTFPPEQVSKCRPDAVALTGWCIVIKPPCPAPSILLIMLLPSSASSFVTLAHIFRESTSSLELSFILQVLKKSQAQL